MLTAPALASTVLARLMQRYESVHIAWSRGLLGSTLKVEKRECWLAEVTS